MLASVTVKVYVLPLRPVILDVVLPLLQLYVIGVVPPVTTTDIAPLADPLQVTLEMESLAMVSGAGCMIVALAVAVQLWLSVTVTV